MKNLSEITSQYLDPPISPDLSGQTRAVRCFAEIAGGQIEYHEHEPCYDGWCWQAVVCEISLTLETDEDGNWWVDIDSGLTIHSSKLWEGVSQCWYDYKMLFSNSYGELLKVLLWEDICKQQGETFIFN